MQSNLSPEDKAAVLKHIELAMRDIEYFAEHFLKHLLTAKVPEFHKEIYRLLPKNKRMVISSFRGSGKSTVASVIYSIWLGVNNRKNDITIISASETLAVELLRKVKREFESNQTLIKYFGDLRTDKWSETHATLTTGVNFRARGAGSQIRGFRPDCLILDDIETDELVESEEQRRKLKDWLFKSCLNTLMPEGQLVLVGSVLHPLALIKDILVSDNGWTKRNYMAYKDFVEKEGYELWPDVWNHERLQVRKREIGSRAFASEYLNSPSMDDTVPIKEEHIKYWETLPEQMNMVISVDPAYSEDENADYKVASLIGMDNRSNRYLVTYVRTHIPSGEFMDAIINLWQQNKNQVTKIGIPNSGVEKQFFSSFVSRCNERKVYPPICEIKNSFTMTTGRTIRGKVERIIAALQPIFEQGKYFINKNHLEAREELLTISSAMRWDDLVDSIAGAEQLLEPTFFDLTPKESEWAETKKLIPNYGYA